MSKKKPTGNVKIKSIDTENQVVYVDMTDKNGHIIGKIAIYGDGLIEMSVRNGNPVVGAVKMLNVGIQSIGTDEMGIYIGQMQISNLNKVGN